MSPFAKRGHIRITRKDSLFISMSLSFFLNKTHVALLSFWKGTISVLGYSYEEEVNKSFESYVTETFGLSERWQTPFCFVGKSFAALDLFLSLAL